MSSPPGRRPDFRTVPYLALYQQAPDETVPNHAAACWESVAVQERRFEVLSDLYPLAGRRILDAGCSRGDFAAWLLERGVSFARYTGIDAIPDVVAQARRRQLDRCEFVCGDLLENPSLLAAYQPDVVCISGTLNTLLVPQAFALLESAWTAAREALLFNFLSDRAGPQASVQTDPIRRLPTLELISWALARTPLVAFRQDYLDHGHDATIRMVN